jgi:hypothetical protein
MGSINPPKRFLRYNRIATYDLVFSHLIAETGVGMSHDEMSTIMQNGDYTFHAELYSVSKVGRKYTVWLVRR